MAEVRLKQYLATVRVRLAEEVILQHSPSSAEIVGNELTEQIHAYVQQHKLGYYPALDFFENNGGLDPELLQAAENMSWLLCRLVREEFQSKLRQVFSRVQFHSAQTLAYTMPAVRYGSANALHDLSLHYTPLSVKLELVLTMISKNSKEGAEDFIKNALHRWLKDSFEMIDVSTVDAISQ
jgi:hypothetical protein